MSTAAVNLEMPPDIWVDICSSLLFAYLLKEICGIGLISVYTYKSMLGLNARVVMLEFNVKAAQYRFAIIVSDVDGIVVC